VPLSALYLPKRGERYKSWLRHTVGKHTAFENGSYFNASFINSCVSYLAKEHRYNVRFFRLLGGIPMYFLREIDYFSFLDLSLRQNTSKGVRHKKFETHS